MTHVLTVAAFQFGDPVTFFVEMKSSDLSIHGIGSTFPAHETTCTQSEVSEDIDLERQATTNR
jgi:hypothetical protein